MNAMQQELYERMGLERVNVEFMFARDDDVDPVITCRFREWSAGRNAGRMILAGGRTLDEALAYAYTGLCDNEWIPLDWRLRAIGVGVVSTVTPKLVPVRQPIDVRALLTGRDDDFLNDDTSPAVNVPQQGAGSQPKRNGSKDSRQPTTR